MNKNIQNVVDQINNSLELLLNLKLIKFYNPVKVEYNKVKDETKISWNNHEGGRNVSSNAFLRIDQYLSILEQGSYHALLNDFSIIRVSFTFQQNKLISQNLLWWPCPVKVDMLDDGEYSPYEIVSVFLDDKDYYRMRSPIRIDFDCNNDTATHPKAHIHTQHSESRMNTIKPICFNTFIKFIFNHYYPTIDLDNSKFNSIILNFERKKEIDYVLKEKLIIC